MSEKEPVQSSMLGRNDPELRHLVQEHTELRALHSMVMARLRFDNTGNTMFNGRRNMAVALGYAEKIDPGAYRARYQRNGVASRVVEAKPQSTWRGGGELVEDDDPKVITDFEKAWYELDGRLKVWNMFERADILAGLGRYAVVLIGAPGNFEMPLQRVRTQDVFYLSPFAEEDAPISEFVTSSVDPRFGQALFYELRRVTNRASGVGTVGAPVGTRVHWSRCLHIADGLLDDTVYGYPRLERVWNLLDDLEKCTGGGSEAFWKRADRGLQFDLDKEMDLSEPEKARMKTEIEQYTNELKRILTTRGVTVNELGSDVASFKEPAAAIIDQIAASVGIPQRILMGSEAGHLASTQDQENWAQRIRDRRRQYAEPLIVNPFVDRLIEWGALPKPKEYRVRWSELESLGDGDRAKIASILAKANKDQGEEIITSDEIRDRILGLGARKGKIRKMEIAPAPKPGLAAVNG